jgi:CheY-like chemotaxis protein
MNLAVNARDAMPHGGSITIATRNLELDDVTCREYPDCNPGDYALLAITDTGCGMTEQVQAHIFEPFFTTKEVGKGTGLGLSTVYGIVKQSGGFIAVDSILDVGTTFNILLPTTMDEPDLSVSEAVLPDIQRGNETILLVEDEDGVRKLARLILTTHGYQVLEASNGQDALNVEQNHTGPIHLLISDIVMPNMSGRQLVESLLPRRPGIKVLYISGYVDDAILRQGVEGEARAFLQKPFSLHSLAAKVRELLDE